MKRLVNVWNALPAQSIVKFQTRVERLRTASNLTDFVPLRLFTLSLLLVNPQLSFSSFLIVYKYETYFSHLIPSYNLLSFHCCTSVSPLFTVSLCWREPWRGEPSLCHPSPQTRRNYRGGVATPAAFSGSLGLLPSVLPLYIPLCSFFVLVPFPVLHYLPIPTIFCHLSTSNSVHLAVSPPSAAPPPALPLPPPSLHLLGWSSFFHLF